MSRDEQVAAQTRRLLHLLSAVYTPKGVQMWLAHETPPAETRQWHAPICDGCGEPIRSENDRNAGSYRVRGFLGRISERSGTWHRACTPKAFYERWGKW